MGGSGSGSSGFTSRGGIGMSGGTGSGNGRFDCDSYATKAVIRSPKKEVISKLKPCDTLYLSLKDKKPPILLSTEEGELAGSIVVPEQSALIKCINKGTSYAADVEAIEAGTCIIEIYSYEDDE